ncbi:MAG: hypothetical protein ACXWYT_04185 [Actinomycetota bacterium]
MAAPRRAASRPNRPLIVAGLVLVGVLAFVGGMLLANAGDGGDDRATASPSTSSDGSPSAPPDDSPSPSPTSQPTTGTAVLDDGRHFVFVKELPGAPPDRMTFDLAEFLTGDAAAEAAAEHGDESPPPNDYYIVNDNPRLRTLPISAAAELRIIDWADCCGSFVVGELSSLADALVHGDPTGTYRPSSPFWITVEGGAIVTIEEQYLP